LSLGRFKYVTGIPFKRLLPWKSLALNAAITCIAAAVAVVIKEHLDTSLLVVLFATGTCFSLVYIGTALTVGLLTRDERQALFDSIQRLPVQAARVGHIIKG